MTALCLLAFLAVTGLLGWAIYHLWLYEVEIDRTCRPDSGWGDDE